MGTIYVDTGGAATNSGTSDANSATVSGSAATRSSANTVTLDGSPDLSFLTGRTSGSTQAAIYLSGATNSNQKIFWITGFDNGAKTVTVSVDPTGINSPTTTAWAIDGRFVWTPASIESAVRPGDLVQPNNSPASSATVLITPRVSGTSAGGMVRFIGKTGTRPVWTNTSTGNVIAGNSTNVLNWFENMEIVQQGASGNAINSLPASMYFNLKCSDAGGSNYGDSNANANQRIFASQFTGAGADGITLGGGVAHIFGNYIHDQGGDGIEQNSTNPSFIIQNNIVDTCAGRGIYLSAGPTSSLAMISINGNTVYGCGNSGVEVADADYSLTLFNNIISENGNAAGEYNLEWAAGTMEFTSFHAWNDFYTAGAGGSGNLLNATVNAVVANSEVTTDPSFTNAASGDFSIGSSSPAKATGFPGAFLGGSTGYLDMGAVQRQEAGGGGGNANILRGSVVA